MKRLHLHIHVKNLERNIKFYSSLFNAKPIKVKFDYAQWILEDPTINFAISTGHAKIGLDHLGIQVEGKSQLDEIRNQLFSKQINTHTNGETTCCYAKAEKSWIEDPNGIAWEAYHKMDDAEVYGEEVPVNNNKITQSSGQSASHCESFNKFG